MNNETTNVPDVIRQEAKDKALKIIQKTEGAISFVRESELDTQALFVPVVTVIKASEEDFHNIQGGVKMPKSHYTNQIAEATGVDIVDVRVTKTGEFTWSGHAEGERRQPDGTMRKGSGEYEFDAEKRAEEDFLKDAAKYTSEISKRKHVLELARFGAQRASTGARLALIRYLAGIPTGFTSENIRKAMIFVRVDRNVNGILQDPNMRQAAIQHALGAGEAVFGPAEAPAGLPASPEARRIEAQPAAEPEGQPEGNGGEGESEPPTDGFTDDIPWEESDEEIARRALENFLSLKDTRLEKSKYWPGAKDVIRATLDDKKATLAAMQDLIKKTEGWLKQMKVPLPTDERRTA